MSPAVIEAAESAMRRLHATPESVAEAIGEAIALEIEAAIENPSDDTVDAYHFDGLDEAARIVRGGAA